MLHLHGVGVEILLEHEVVLAEPPLFLVGNDGHNAVRETEFAHVRSSEILFDEVGKRRIFLEKVCNHIASDKFRFGELDLRALREAMLVVVSSALNNGREFSSKLYAVIAAIFDDACPEIKIRFKRQHVLRKLFRGKFSAI